MMWLLLIAWTSLQSDDEANEDQEVDSLMSLISMMRLKYSKPEKVEETWVWLWITPVRWHTFHKLIAQARCTRIHGSGEAVDELHQHITGPMRCSTSSSLTNTDLFSRKQSFEWTHFYCTVKVRILELNHDKTNISLI